MRYINPTKAGFSVGVVIGLWHLAWVSLVAAGWAKPVMDYILRLHFIDVRYALAPFELTPAATLIAITFALGFVLGSLFALVWNWLAQQPEPAAAKPKSAATA